MRVGDLEAGVVHAERREDVFAQVHVELLAARRLHRLADEVDIGAVFPARAGIGHNRRLQRGVLAGDDAGRGGLLQIFPDVAVPHVVGEARGVRHEQSQRDRLLGGAQFRLAAGVKAFQHLRVGQIRQQLADRLVQRELALLDELHAGGARNRLGHGGDPEHAVGGHRIVLGQVALAERALIDHLAAGGRHRDHAGDFLGLAFLTQNLVDLGFALHGSPPDLFLWSGAIFLPAMPSRKRSSIRRWRCRDLVVGGAWAAGRIPRHKTATLRRKPRRMGRYAGDRLNHPRYRDFAMIPEADFFQ